MMCNELMNKRRDELEKEKNERQTIEKSEIQSESRVKKRKKNERKCMQTEINNKNHF